MREEKGVVEFIGRLSEAWNRADWSGFSQSFVDEADYVTGAGVRLHGARQIQAELEGRAAEGPVSEVRVAIESVEMLATDVALALCSWRMGTGNSARAGLMTLVLKDVGHGWRIVTLHNTNQSR